jgi:hypothetical protein
MVPDTQVLDREEPTVKEYRAEERSSIRIATQSYSLAVFLSAFLLFQVELTIGKYILPFFGGAPAVWDVCLLFFQVLLLLGYAYAYWLSRRPLLQAQGKTHVAFLAVTLVVVLALWVRWGTPLTPGAAWLPTGGASPIFSILKLLTVTVALPFFILSATGPLLQHWYSQMHSGKAPYRLYATSNLGSLLGLLSYPFFVEWAFTTRHAAQLWAAGFTIFTFVCVGIASGLRREVSEARQLGEAEPEARKAPGMAKILLWLGLSTCSSMMLLATTNLLCQDILPIPLLWVLPLGIYLLSFILTFQSDRWYRRELFWPLYALILGLDLQTFPHMQVGWPPREIAVLSTALLAVCVICHGEVARAKPSANHSTLFYLVVAFGGALGGILVAIAAPFIFRGFWEFEIALFGCGFLFFVAFVVEDRTGGTKQGMWAASLAVLAAFLVPQLAGLLPVSGVAKLLSNKYYVAGALATAFSAFTLFDRRKKFVPTRKDSFPWQPAATLLLLGVFGVLAYVHSGAGQDYILLQTRNFFGVKYVTDDLNSIKLISGNIVHGAELKDPGYRNTPTTYYQRSTGIGLLLDNYPRAASGVGSNLKIGVVGLGVGTLAAYGRAGDRYRFYEIDPAVADLSKGARPYFHFLQDSPATVEVVLGDARIVLQQEASDGKLQQFDVLALDAFSSDAIPVHLLTKEAGALYLKHLRGPNSVLAFHVSNRYVDLGPVVKALCDTYHLHAAEVRSGTERWILASRNAEMLRLPKLSEKSKIFAPDKTLLWTDDYTNLFLVLRRAAFF